MDNKINDGLKYMLVSALCLAIMGSMAKVLSSNLPTIEIVFFRNSLGVILICISILKSPLKQVGGKPLLLFFRAFIGLIAMLSFFYNIANISLSDAVTYSRLSPIFTAIFALWFLKEKIGTIGWFAISLGFIGMLFVMQPNGLEFEKSHLFGILNALCAALAFTSIRELKKYYDTRAIVLSFMGIGTLVPVLAMVLSRYYTNDDFSFLLGTFIMPDSSDWLFILGIGLSSTLGQIYLTKAYGITRAGLVGAVGYTVIPFSLIIGLFLGDELPNTLAFVGIFAIITGGLLIAKSKN